MKGDRRPQDPATGVASSTPRELLRRYVLARVVAAALTEEGHEVLTPDDGDLDDVERARWMVCLAIVERLMDALLVPLESLV